jgi:hypothetical protein
MELKIGKEKGNLIHEKASRNPGKQGRLGVSIC